MDKSELYEKIKDELREKTLAVTDTLNQVIIGKSEQVKILIAALLSGGHALIEDVPGTGKTTLAAALSQVTGSTFGRIQLTPDVTASDITGYNVYNRQKEIFEFCKGAVMCDLLLADEINRATPKTQSSLLEAMEERKVTVDGKLYELPKSFCVIATQNPSGFVGTYPLPESQLDRFSVRISLGYPTAEDECNIVSYRCGQTEAKKANGVMSREEFAATVELVSQVKADEKIIEYAVALVSATRDRKEFTLGAGPRASIALIKTAQAYAFINGRDYIIPEDIAALYLPVVAHRITVSGAKKLETDGIEAVLDSILKSTKVPFVK